MNESKPNLTRRQFIQGALAGSSLIMAGCSSLDSLFTESRRFFEDEVLIIGAGLAGLSAAYHLKKNKVPYRVYEASERVGGRVLSVKDFGSEKLWGELGAEFAFGDQTHLMSLAKDLGYRPIQLNNRLRGEDLYFNRGQVQTSALLKKDIPRLAKTLRELEFSLFQGQNFDFNHENIVRYPKLLEFDTKTVQEFADELKKTNSTELVEILVAQIENRFGVRADQMSAFHFLLEHKKRSGGTYVLPGGWGQLVQTLFDRVSGAVPRYLIKTQHQLSAVNKNPLGYELSFRTPEGKRSLIAKKVIFALPVSAYASISGLEKLEIGEQKVAALRGIQMGQTQKGLFVAENLKLSSSTYAIGSDLRAGALWQTSADEGRQVCAFMRSEAKVEIFESIISADLERINLANKGKLKEVGPVVSWGNRQTIRGSLPFYGPQQFTRWKGLFVDSGKSPLLQFAGDFDSSVEYGTMESAISSGIRAAKAFV